VRLRINQGAEAWIVSVGLNLTVVGFLVCRGETTNLGPSIDIGAPYGAEQKTK
jgi:hypothetical protein